MSNDAHKAMFNTFLQPDPHSMGLLKLLKEIYPAFAKRIFQKNKFMEKIVLSNLNPMDIMEYPICGRCETLAAWSGVAERNGKYYQKCTCFADGCGHTTVNPITLRQWMMEELKHKAPPDIAEIAEIAVDIVSQKMMQMAFRDYEKAVGRLKPQREKQMGILMPDGTERKIDEAEKKKAEEMINEEINKIKNQIKEKQ